MKLLYGKYNSNFVFSYILRRISYIININNSMLDDKIICKMDINAVSIYALSINGQIFIYVLNLSA